MVTFLLLNRKYTHAFWVRKLMEKTDKYVVYPSFFLYAYEYAANTDAQSTLVSHFKFYFENRGAQALRALDPSRKVCRGGTR